MGEQMMGVVLWADAHDSRAVIWCEDQGNLAYYSEGEEAIHEGVALDAGDLIQFDCREEKDMRRVRNPRRVTLGHAPELPAMLRARLPKRRAQKPADVIRISDFLTRRAS